MAKVFQAWSLVNMQAFPFREYIKHELVRLTSLPMVCFKHALAVNTQGFFLQTKTFSMHLWCTQAFSSRDCFKLSFFLNIQTFHLGNESSMRL